MLTDSKRPCLGLDDREVGHSPRPSLSLLYDRGLLVELRPLFRSTDPRRGGIPILPLRLFPLRVLLLLPSHVDLLSSGLLPISSGVVLRLEGVLLLLSGVLSRVGEVMLRGLGGDGGGLRLSLCCRDADEVFDCCWGMLGATLLLRLLPPSWLLDEDKELDLDRLVLLKWPDGMILNA